VLEQVPDDVDEIMIVDGNSTDVTPITARAYRPDVRIMPQQGTANGSALYRPRPCTGISPRHHRRFRLKPVTAVHNLPSEIFHTEPAALSALSSVDALANMVVELQHCEGWTVRTKMSRSALMRHDDPVVLVTFDNSTELLWGDER
jgi:glycosyltransferase involved in cell wall biosynthesis